MALSDSRCCADKRRLQVVGENVRAMSLRLCALLVVLLVTMQQTEARPSQRVGSGLLLPFDQESSDAIYDSQMAEPRGEREMENMMLQMLQKVAQQQQQQQHQQQQQQQDEVEQELIPAPLEESFGPQPDALPVSDKRGSYMSLCHFKICNMGRKRNLRRSQWNRL